MKYPLKPGACLRSFPLFLFAGALTSHAATITWDGGGADNKFNTAANWSPDAAVSAIAGNDFRFGTLVGGGQTTADVNVSGNFSSLWFDAGASAMTITASGNAMQFATATATPIQNNSSNAQWFNATLRQFWITGTANRTWSATSAAMTYDAVRFRPDSSVGSSFTLTFDGAFNHTVNTNMNLEGTWTGKTVGINKNGSGTLLLKGGADFNGKTTINNGVIRIQSSSSLGTSAVAEGESTSILAGTALEIDGSVTTTEFIRVAGTGIGGNGAIRAVSGTTNHNSQIAMEGTGGAAVSFGVSAGATLKVNRLYSDPGRDTNFEKVGAGTLVLKANNSDDYVGNTTITAGTLQVGDSGTSGELKTTGVTNHAALVFNRSNAYDYTGAIEGTGSLTQAGAGVLTLSGNSTYDGATLVSSGTLLVNGSLANTSSVSVSSGATLGGTGTIGANVTIANGAFLSPGASIESLGINGNTTVNGTLLVEFDGTGIGNIDLLSVTGALNISNATVDFSMLSGGNLLDDPAYVFATYTSLTGSQFLQVDNLPSGYSIDYFYNGNSIALVPEPASMVIGGMSIGLLVLRRRRNHRQS